MLITVAKNESAHGGAVPPRRIRFVLASNTWGGVEIHTLSLTAALAVFFDAVMFGPTGVRVVMLNPLAPLLEGLRLSIVHGHGLLSPLIETTAGGQELLAWAPWYLGYSALWTALVLVGSALLFHRSEFVFAEYV